MRFNREQRKVFAEKVLELANIAAGGLIFGQFLSEKSFSPILAIVGFILLLYGYVLAYFLLKK